MIMDCFPEKVSDWSLLSTERRTFDFCFVGNEHPIKGIDRLKEFVLNSKFLFAIVGNVKPFINTTRVKFFGQLRGKKKQEIISESYWLFMPSYHESMSMVIIEALSCGTPVVAYDMPTLKSIYNKGVYFVQDWKQWSNEAKEMSKQFNWTTEARKIL